MGRENVMEVKFYDTVNDELLKFAVIISQSNGKWVFCKHKERDTYEVPGGHSEMEKVVLMDELPENWTYPLIQPKLIEKYLQVKNNSIIGATVTVTVDRPLGSYHPEYKDMYYPINYGYIKGVMAPDGEEQDAYILGVNEPVKKFTGKIIAIVRRKDDIEEKWVVVPDGVTFSKEEIRRQIHFQEQYFDSEIVM